jgi:cytochrome oxidase Cu insertion factor (SCO1/SenC/PrrC family)
MARERFNNSVVLVSALLIAGALIAMWMLKAKSERSEITSAQIVAKAQRAKAPDFELKDLEGKSVRLSDYRGKTILVNFWASW